MKFEERIEKTKQSFEESFRADSYYNKQTQDKKHLSLIVNYLQVEAGMKILDLGTGTGYLAFPIAEKYLQAEVIGLDIVEKTLEENQKRAVLVGLNNLHFVNYEGMKFPFDDDSFDIVITRYALHHFPVIEDTFCEINRVLKKNGIFLLSDPAPNDNDLTRFVDEYMQMKKDGHIKFYTKEEWKEIGRLSGFDLIDGFQTTIRFPKKRETALEFDDIISRHDDTVIKGYEVEIIDDEIWITEKVNNLLFQKG
jgi:ubiquinone/menaquinone biosynthesis C-methylase UbiE